MGSIRRLGEETRAAVNAALLTAATVLTLAVLWGWLLYAYLTAEYRVG